MMLAAILTVVCCTEVPAQGQRGMMKVDGIVTVPVTNISLTNGPQLLSDNSVKFTVRAQRRRKCKWISAVRNTIWKRVTMAFGR